MASRTQSSEAAEAGRNTIEYSFVVPVFNDQYLLEAFCTEFERVMLAYVGASGRERFELVVVDDGSRNFDRDEMRRLCRGFSFVKVIRLSRNFGQHVAVSCGYRHASGAYVGMLNADMEDPPDQIPVLLDRIRTGEHDIVYGLRRKRRGPWATRLTSLIFNALLNKLTGFEVPLNVATLRVMKRRFVDAYNALSESSRYIPGLEMWLGFSHGYVEIEHRERKAGRSSYDFGKRLAMAFDSIISFSDLPLRMVAYGGLVIALIGFLLTLILVVAKLLLVDFESGYASTISLIVALGGVQILVVGVASVYVGRILKEVQGRPLYVVRETINLDERVPTGPRRVAGMVPPVDDGGEANGERADAQ